MRIYDQGSDNARPLELHEGHRIYRLHVQSNGRVRLPAQATHFCFVASGGAGLSCASGEFQLGDQMYCAVPGAAVWSPRGPSFAISQADCLGLFTLGGPIEDTGRLRYIDGCSDTLLIAPLVRGDACLNLLHVPPGVDQTAHTHPSIRVGMVVRGSGVCRTGPEQFPLCPHCVFVIPADEEHSFHTGEQALHIVAFHPDSDFGPTHEDHPMLNRTIIER